MQTKKQAHATIAIVKKEATVQKMKKGARFYLFFASWLVCGCGLQRMLYHISITKIKVNVKSSLDYLLYHMLYSSMKLFASSNGNCTVTSASCTDAQVT